MTPRISAAWLAGGLPFVCLFPSIASAQVTPAVQAAPVAQADAPNAEGVADIIVTAERRQSSVQKTPLAITAIGGGDLQKQQITNLEGLGSKLPSVNFQRSGTDARIYIRGIGIDAVSPGQDPRVAIYSDGVYNARTQAVLGGLYDIERVEVLRGPQGTLYGRNSTAGAINIITRDPTSTLSGYGTLAVGNYALVQTEGAIGGPLSDALSARVSFQTANRNGYGENIQTGGEVDDQNTRAVRAKLLFQPSSDVKISLNGDYYREDDHSGGYHFIRDYPGRTNVGVLFGYVVPDSPRDYAGQGPNAKVTNYGTALTGVFGLGDIEITSISAYRHLNSRIETSADQSTAGFAPVTYLERSNQFSQELRAAYSAGRFKLVTGAYYFHEKNFAETAAPLSGAYFGLDQALRQGAQYGGSQKTNAYALFAQGTFDITDTLGVDLGIRYSREKRSTVGYNQFDFGRLFPSTPTLLPGLFIPISGSKTYTATDPKVALHYQLTQTILLYASYTKGFKSGGFNIGFPQPAFNPEKITDYEGGIKADLFERRLRINLSAFHYGYSQLQVNITEGVQLLTTNAGKAELYGGELELTALPTDDLRLSANIALLHAKFTEYDTGDPANPELGTLDLSGNRLSNAPSLRINTEVGYTFHTRVGDITPRATVDYTGKVYFDQFNRPFNDQAGKTLVNLNLDLDAGKGWSASAFVKNLTNKLYVTSSTVSAGILGFQIAGTVGAPRTFGLSVTKQF